MPNKQNGKKAILILVAIFIGVIVLSFGLAHTLNKHRQYDSIHASNSAELFKSYKKSKNITIAIFYKHTCSDCLSVQSTVVPLVKKNENKKNIKYVALDRLNKNDNKLFTSENVTHTPTFNVYYHGLLLYGYTGTNKHIIKNILNGENPSTKQHFTKVINNIK